MALDATGLAHISYYDGRNGNLKYAHWTGSAWDIQTVDSEGGAGGWTSLSLDEPHSSYGGNGDLKCAHYFAPEHSICQPLVLSSTP